MSEGNKETLQQASSAEQEEVSSEQTSKVLVQLIQALTKIEALEKQDTTQPHFVGANQDFVFESDLHYGTYCGLRYG